MCRKNCTGFSCFSFYPGLRVRPAQFWFLFERNAITELSFPCQRSELLTSGTLTKLLRLGHTESSSNYDRESYWVSGEMSVETDESSGRCCVIGVHVAHRRLTELRKFSAPNGPRTATHAGRQTPRNIPQSSRLVQYRRDSQRGRKQVCVGKG